MMIYLKPSSKKRQKKILTRGALILLALVILLLFSIYPPEFLRRPLVALATPFWQARDLVANIFQTAFLPFAEKKKLLAENLNLKNELERKNLTLAALEDLAVENQEFKELGGRNLKEPFILATVLNRPPVSAYDTFVIDVGSENGVDEGDLVAITENTVVGEVTSVFSHNALVSLFSTPDRETQVAIGIERAEAPARGRGGGNFEIRLPKGVAVETGDAIILPSIGHRLLGFVSKIETGPNDPFQTILSNLPLNLNTLRFVMILKK